MEHNLNKIVILIGGQTASGKSVFAIRLAMYLLERYGVQSEIINADSMQMYDDLKILTAFPSNHDLESVVHHLYGTLSPYEPSSVAFWLDSAVAVINRLHMDGKIAIVCGGTGFYLDAIMNGVSKLPKIPDEFRIALAEKFHEFGRDTFFEKLAEIDPESSRVLHKNDTQRILRAYEVVSFTGKPLPEWWRSDVLDSPSFGWNLFSIVIAPDKTKLHEKCLLRIMHMINNGAIEEVALFAEMHSNYNGPLAKTIGYEDIILFLNGKISKKQCIDYMNIHTRQYAKRQSTWFRNRMKSATFLNHFGYDNELENFLDDFAVMIESSAR